MIDMERFNARLANNTAVIDQILKLFSDQFGSNPEFIRAPFNKQDSDELFQAAHSLKGTLANICADKDAEIAEQIETISREGAMPDESLILAMEESIAQIEAQIQAHFA